MEKEIIDQKQLLIEENEIDLLDLLKTIYRNRGLILGIAVVVTILGLVFALLQKPQYTSEMTFVEQKSNNNNSMLASLASSIPFGLGGNLSGGESSSLTTIIDSRSFRTEIIKKLDLKNYIINSQKLEKEAIEKLDKQAVDAWLKKSMTVTQDSKTGVYKINVKMEDRAMATKIANTYFYALDDYLKNQKLDKNKINREYLEKQVSAVEKDLDLKQQTLKVYEEEYNTASIDVDSKIAVESVAKIKGLILETEGQLNVAREIYGEESLEVTKLRESLFEFNRQLENLENGTGSVKFIPLKDIPKIKYDLEKLSTEIKATSEVYKMLRVQLEQAKLDEISNRSVIELLDEAVIPKVPSSTSKKLILIISGVLGLFMGIFVGFVKEFAKGIEWKEFKN